jgi:methionine-rich copper-binding protein CopC
MLRRSLLLVTLIAFGAAAVQLATPSPASAHAAVSSTEPRADATITELPRRVFIHVIKKAATRAGDPMQVYGPDGARVDSGDVVVSDGGSSISVGLQQDAATAGIYFVQFQITSADTHIIEDRFSFTLAPPGGATGQAASGITGAPAARVTTPGRLRVIGPPAASIVAAGLVVLALGALGAMARRRRRRAEEPQRPLFRVVSTDEHRFGPIPPAPPTRHPRPAGSTRPAGNARPGGNARPAGVARSGSRARSVS